VLRWFEEPAAIESLRRDFASVHQQLRQGGAGLAADAVLELVRP